VVDRGQPFEIHDDRSDATVTLRLYGEFDIAGCQQYEAALEGIDLSTVRELVVDLGGVTFIDSSAMRSLLGTKAHADRNGFEMSVALPPPDGQVRRVLELTGLDAVLTRDGDAA